MFYDRGSRYEFVSLSQELAAPGELRQTTWYDFEFRNVEKQYESYHGINVKLRYFVRVTLARRMGDLVKEFDIWVYSYKLPSEGTNSIKMEVGIEDCLHIEFEYNKSKQVNKYIYIPNKQYRLTIFKFFRYHLKDVIVGKIYFLLVRIKIKHMELAIIRRETAGTGKYIIYASVYSFDLMFSLIST
jgi:vacuolar protein sorting-associated protein 26